MNRKLNEADVTSQVKSFLQAHGWRAIRMNRGLMQNAFGGVIQFGEAGMADFLFVRYAPEAMPAAGLMLWVEMKATGVKAKCRCTTKRAMQRCSACDQKVWRERERLAGAQVWLVDSLDWFMEEYERVFGWLHHGDAARGQLDLLAGVTA